MKYRIAASILLCNMLLVMPVFAHPPKGIELVFESNTKVLRVNISHFVDDPAKHYIEKVVVELNGEEIITQTFKMQTDKQTQEIMYVVVGAQEGDKIAVTAYCNISGKKKETMDVILLEKPEVEEEQ